MLYIQVTYNLLGKVGWLCAIICIWITRIDKLGVVSLSTSLSQVTFLYSTCPLFPWKLQQHFKVSTAQLSKRHDPQYVYTIGCLVALHWRWNTLDIGPVSKPFESSNTIPWITPTLLFTWNSAWTFPFPSSWDFSTTCIKVFARRQQGKQCDISLDTTNS